MLRQPHTGGNLGNRSGRKGAAAAAASGSVGILEDEALAHQGFFVLQRGAVQIEKTLWVDEQARTEFFENFIAVAGLRVEAHSVRQAGAAAALHAYAQAALIEGHAVFFEQRADFFCSAFGQVDFRRIRRTVLIDVWRCRRSACRILRFCGHGTTPNPQLWFRPALTLGRLGRSAPRPYTDRQPRSGKSACAADSS